MERARRVVNVLEMEKGRTLSSRTSSISKPFPYNIEPVFPKRKRAETSLREVRSWPSQFWLAGAFVVLVRRRESDYPSRNQGTVAKIGRGRETKDNPQRT